MRSCEIAFDRQPGAYAAMASRTPLAIGQTQSNEATRSKFVGLRNRGAIARPASGDGRAGVHRLEATSLQLPHFVSPSNLAGETLLVL